MTDIHRRAFMRTAGGVAVLGATLGFPYLAMGATRRVVVVGGGVGGATAAKYLRKLDPGLSVTLIEAKPNYTSCFMSNEVLSGDRTLDSLTFGYDGLRNHGVEVVIDRVSGIDPVSKTVQTDGGKEFSYDACVVSPGIGFKWEAIEGYDENVAEEIPHAWYAGPQTLTLRRQLEAMPEGGKVLIAAPQNPFKCPPGPYERASQIAMYCKHHKPRAKIIILDPKDAFSKQGLYVEGWTKLYGYGSDNSMIEWVSGAEGGAVEAVDPGTRTLQTFVEDFQGDVVNIIPPQKAGAIAFAADLVEGDWCPVDKRTFESSRHKDIYVLGDASSASKMPKSAYAANSQAKVAAAAIVARFSGQEPDDPTFVNTCYSIVGEDFGISVAAVYSLDAANNSIEPIPNSGGVSPANASPELRKREVSYAHSWFSNVINDMME
ncbi:NAD(P)/FAD-dependent oxidoreductase [Thiohalomonas denitrificans]|uniref:Sulfide dehydrogenase [flavocytochrome c] flavoprotein chain n=1 Tax=Thiohalomonas denitrificans TaxID=415747 RepID=A0A1G5QEM2_9GAMM|nr:NAD(P)/FAD-dependent oxidoreductase [Thiohalomonas denitrificans]SCZ60137.1 sulfide dehydrogenase [flavocytochrome c] flavoprotein chain [Thiohalomonas denitrificans]